MEGIRIHIIDDEAPMRELLHLYLEKEGYIIDASNNGFEAIRKTRETSHSIVLLDVMMPEVDGFEVCTEIRKVSNVPIIMLTARNQVMDKVTGLQMGADDYITKPFDHKELLARIEAILRRNNENRQEVQKTKYRLQYKGIAMDRQARQVFYLNNELSLTPKEYAILELFLLRRNRVFSRDDILELIWGYDHVGDYRGVDTHVKHLRDKLTEAGISGKDVVKTVWGVGYKMI